MSVHPFYPIIEVLIRAVRMNWCGQGPMTILTFCEALDNAPLGIRSSIAIESNLPYLGSANSDSVHNLASSPQALFFFAFLRTRSRVTLDATYWAWAVIITTTFNNLSWSKVKCSSVSSLRLLAVENDRRAS